MNTLQTRAKMSISYIVQFITKAKISFYNQCKRKLEGINQ